MTAPADQNPGNPGTGISGTLERIAAVEAQHLPDVVVPLRELTWSVDGSVTIPSHGSARPNDWARQQIGSLLGVRFDRWFESATPEERSDEMTRRLHRSRGNVRLRIALAKEGTILRAVVTPSYSPIPDSLILGTLEVALRGSPAKVHRTDITERMTSVMICVGEPQGVGGIIGATWGSIVMTNSGVGWSGLSVSISLLRLVCTNGMKAPVFDANILKVRHRSIDIHGIRNQLVGGIRSLPVVVVKANQVLAASATWKVRDVEAEVHAVLREAGMIRHHQPQVLAAYRREPHPSVFGLSQALTLHAQTATPEDRVMLEALAGSYVARSAP